MAKEFTQTENLAYFIRTIPVLPDLQEPLNDKFYTKKSPLKATLYAHQEGNQIMLQLTIENTLNQQWFYKKHDNGDLFSFKNDQDSFLQMTYPPRRGGVPVDSVNALTDDEYALIEPHETIKFEFSIPASLFYEGYKGENIYFYYINYGLPPSLSNKFSLISKETNTDSIYEVVFPSNQIRIRCYEYSPSQNKYYCDVETLPNLPTFK